MELLIVKDSYRAQQMAQPYHQYDEEGIKTTVCSSNTFCQLPSMSFDLVVIDLVKKTLEGGDFEFLNSLGTQAYRAVIAIADQCSNGKEVQATLREMGIEDYLERPLTKEVFFTQVDHALNASMARAN